MFVLVLARNKGLAVYISSDKYIKIIVLELGLLYICVYTDVLTVLSTTFRRQRYEDNKRRREKIATVKQLLQHQNAAQAPPAGLPIIPHTFPVSNHTPRSSARRDDVIVRDTVSRPRSDGTEIQETSAVIYDVSDDDEKALSDTMVVQAQKYTGWLIDSKGHLMVKSILLLPGLTFLTIS